jgi:hypothetical protein
MEAKIVEQVEHYFKDSSLVHDFFLKNEIAKNRDGWVTIKVLLTFNRLRTICDDPKKIAKAVSKSKSSIIQLSDDRLSIRRYPKKPIDLKNEGKPKGKALRDASDDDNGWYSDDQGDCCGDFDDMYDTD